MANSTEDGRIDATPPALNREVGPSVQDGSTVAAASRWEAKTRNQAGMSLLREGRLHEALAQFSEAVRQDASFVEPYMNAGWVLRDLKRHDEAMDCFRAAVSIDPKQAEAYDGWGRALAATGRHQQALWRFERAIAENAEYFLAYIEAGKALYSLGREKEAEQRFEQALGLTSKRSSVWYEWGLALAELVNIGKERADKLGEREAEREAKREAEREARRAAEYTEKALTKLKEAIRADRRFGPAYVSAGQMLAELDRPDEEMIQLLDEFADSDAAGAQPESAFWASLFAAVAVLKIDRPEQDRSREALRRCDQALAFAKRFSDPRRAKELKQAIAAVHFVAGAARVELKQYPEGIRCLREAMELRPSLGVAARSSIGFTLWRQGKYQEAWQELWDILKAHARAKADPGYRVDVEHLRQLGQTLHLLGEAPVAQEVYTEASRLSSRHPGVWADLVSLYLDRRDDDPTDAAGWYWQARRAFLEAESLLAERLRTDRSPTNLVRIGALRVALGEDDLAEPDLREAVKLDEASPVAHANLGIIQLRRGEFAKAVACFHAAVRRDPDNLLFRIHLADAYSRAGALDRAENEYRGVLQVAPGNVDARIGLAEVLTARGDAGDADAYANAIEQFEEALRLAASMQVREPHRREGSSRLSRRQAAEVHYGRGYAYVKSYETRLDEGLLMRRDERLLKRARSDFAEALKADPGHFKAKRALEKVTERHQRLSRTGFAERVAPGLVALLAFVLLVMVQGSFFFHWPAVRIDIGYYVMLTFGLLVLVVAGSYLPQVLRLKVPGMELEKGPVEKVSVATTLEIARGQLAPGITSAFWPVYEEFTRQVPKSEAGSTDQLTSPLAKSDPERSGADQARSQAVKPQSESGGAAPIAEGHASSPLD